MIFPQFNNIQFIHDIRKKYDPLYKHVAPHITLIFPFDSDISSSDLEEHLRNSLQGVRPFNLTLHGFSQEDGKYLFLNVVEGKKSILEIHKRLYTGILSKYIPDFLRSNDYKPHLTVGRTTTRHELDLALQDCKRISEQFSDYITVLTVEKIDENENSEIELNVELS